jgi:pyruvate,orthophosphate dikinase
MRRPKQQSRSTSSSTKRAAASSGTRRKKAGTKQRRTGKGGAGALPHGARRYVYSFGPGGADGNREMRDLLGGKGANLAEMCNLGLPVPPGFTISTEVCRYYYDHGLSYPAGLGEDVLAAMRSLEEQMGKGFGDPSDPLLVSVRSGARVSMPGMMDTVLNLGLNDETVEGLAKRSGNPRFAWDAYRRFVQMYGDVVMGVGAEGDHGESPFGLALDELKARRGVKQDTELTAEDLQGLVQTYKGIVERVALRSFPEDPMEQLRGAISAVFGSWNNERAIAYRAMNDIPGDWGTAVSVCTMVFGNMGPSSGTGVAFTRDPATGVKRFYGEYLMNAQGEDVVAGLRTPEPIAHLEQSSPRAWKELLRIQKRLEDHYRDMQDLEFTIEDGKLYMLQCRTGKRTGFAAVRIATDLVRERKISKEEALMRIDPEALNQLLQPVFQRAELEKAKRAGRLLTHGLNAGPGAAAGRIYFSAEAAEAHAAAGEDVLLVRTETSPEDIKGMQAAKGILTARGGMTSHAALVARQMGRVCVAGVSDLEVDYKTRSLRARGQRFVEGDWMSLDGTTGAVYEGQIATAPSEVTSAILGGKRRRVEGEVYSAYKRLMGWADEVRQLRVRTNADQPDQCQTAVAFGAEGVGLCRTEHMFFGPGKIEAVREMILAESPEAREAALAKLLPLQRKDFEGIFKAMGDLPVTIRTLDPPLHEFLPHEDSAIRAVAEDLGVRPARIKQKVAQLSELNPMLGHRGCRLGITYPEITRMQSRAIFEAACRVAKRSKVTPRPEVMIPLVSTREELQQQAKIVREVAEEVFEEQGLRLKYMIGTMIELPRAALTAGDIAKEAEFFSFGTNDLTQTTFGISRDDAGKFVPAYRQLDIFPEDPFSSIDVAGVGKLMQIATMDGKAARPDLKLGICGEHGGEPKSIRFCHELGLAYVSCSPYRIPIARLAAAQAALRARH